MAMGSEQTLEDPRNKRPKTLTLCSSPEGKSKIEDISMNDSESISCGICLSEEGKAVRGWIDSCDHFFCFVCIIEWSKVESRCPMCKRRFTSIRRPPNDKLFLSHRVVNVPVRDQIYHYSGNATIGPPDPYSEVRCSVCHGAENEFFLLLCDLCDSAAHTFCVGLGNTVPEGDWFCHDCTILRDEHAKSETYPDCGSQAGFGNLSKGPLAESNVSIFNIIRESGTSENERPIGRVSVADNVTGQVSRAHSIVGSTATQSDARTLGRCRDVHEHIRVLRENWNAFRSGSQSFSSSSIGNRYAGAVQHGVAGRTPSSCSSQKSADQKGSSSIIPHNRATHDIDRAWKLMDVAKSIERNRERTISIVPQASKNPSREISGHPKETSTKLLASNRKRPGNKDRESISSEKNYQYCSTEKDNNTHKHQMFEKEKQCGIAMMGDRKLIKSVSTTCSPVYCELPSSRKDRTSIQVDICHRNGGNSPQISSLGTISNDLVENIGSSCLVSPSVASNTSGGNQVFHASSSCNLERKARMGKSSVDNKASRVDDAKSEIQSLVKLNLKLLSRNKKLEVNVFEEVARLATHSILAACGLVPPKPGLHSFPSSVCRHANEVEQFRRSALVPTSCRECFFAFVKDVVNTIMFQKMGCAENSS